MNANNPTNKKNNPIAKALKLPRGAEFHRCALQVNPYSCCAQFHGQSNAIDGKTHTKATVEKAAEIRGSVLAITNHKT